jgi:cardiolipin synthase
MLRGRGELALRLDPDTGGAAARCELLVGADEFWRRAEADIGAAGRRLHVQAMTFEGDAAGGRVAAAISACRAGDRRILVDDYSRHVVSDRRVRSLHYLRDRRFRAEVRNTGAMFRGLLQDGVGVRLTEPMGPLLHRFAFRNHKKLIVADDVAYIGGINFSDHNFLWPDLMLRIPDRAIADRLAADFADTYAGVAGSWREDFGGMRLYGLDGRDNGPGFAELIALIEQARTSIRVISPYLSFPFVEPLARARARGVQVTLITPLANNKPIVRDYLLRAARRADLETWLTPDMIHMKGLLIDDARLVLGSSNFDFVSYLAEAEFVAVIDDERLAREFRRRVLEPALAAALPATDHQPRAWTGLRSHLVLKAAARLIPLTGRGGRRSVGWRR